MKGPLIDPDDDRLEDDSLSDGVAILAVLIIILLIGLCAALVVRALP
jgi:hypothetical protein